MSKSEFSLENLKLRDEIIRTVQPKCVKERQRRKRSQFVMVPASWMERLDEAQYIGTLKLALHILFRCWKERGQSILVTNTAFGKSSSARQRKRRALSELKNLGLIDLEWRPRKSPRVTIRAGTEDKV